MAALLPSTFLLFRTQFRRAWWSRRALACAALAAGPPVVAWLVSISGEKVTPREIATAVGWFLLLQVVAPLVALVAGSAVVTEEIEDRTITYLFSRPIPRASVLLGRWLAAVVFVSTLLGASAALVVATASGHAAEGPPAAEGVLGPLVAAALLGGAAYTALFAAAGVFFKHPMIVGLGYAFAVEGFLANLPGRNQALTVQHYLRSVAVGADRSAWSGIEGFGLAQFEEPGRAVTTLVVLAAATLALASWRIARREFVLSA